MEKEQVKRPKGITHQEFFQNEFDDANVICAMEGTDSKSRVFLAIEQDGFVFAALCILGTPYGESNFWYSYYDETEPTVFCDCPKEIFQLLTPVDEIPPIIKDPTKQKIARQWRERVASRLTKVHTHEKLFEHEYRILTDGDVFVFDWRPNTGKSTWVTKNRRKVYPTELEAEQAAIIRLKKPSLRNRDPIKFSVI